MQPVNFHDQPGNDISIYQTLLRLRPRSRIIAGMVSIAGGVALTVLLWNRGVVWSLPVFAAVGGIFLFLSGLSGRRKEKERERLLAMAERRQEELISSMVAEKREGRNPVRWLNDQGIHDGEIRTLLLDAMNERLKLPSGK